MNGEEWDATVGVGWGDVKHSIYLSPCLEEHLDWLPLSYMIDWLIAIPMWCIVAHYYRTAWVPS